MSDIPEGQCLSGLDEFHQYKGQNLSRSYEDWYPRTQQNNMVG